MIADKSDLTKLFAIVKHGEAPVKVFNKTLNAYNTIEDAAVMLLNNESNIANWVRLDTDTDKLMFLFNMDQGNTIYDVYQVATDSAKKKINRKNIVFSEVKCDSAKFDFIKRVDMYDCCRMANIHYAIHNRDFAEKSLNTILKQCNEFANTKNSNQKFNQNIYSVDSKNGNLDMEDFIETGIDTKIMSIGIQKDILKKNNIDNNSYRKYIRETMKPEVDLFVTDMSKYHPMFKFIPKWTGNYCELYLFHKELY